MKTGRCRFPSGALTRFCIRCNGAATRRCLSCPAPPRLIRCLKRAAGTFLHGTALSKKPRLKPRFSGEPCKDLNLKFASLPLLYPTKRRAPRSALREPCRLKAVYVLRTGGFGRNRQKIPRFAAISLTKQPRSTAARLRNVKKVWKK